MNEAPALRQTGGESSLRERKRQRTREELFDAAMQLFSEHAYAEVSVEEICRHALAGRATFFRLYGTKAGLLTEYNRRLAGQARDAVALARPRTAAAELRVLGAAVTSGWGPGHPALIEMGRELIAVSRSVDAAGEACPDLLRLVADTLARGRASGEFAPGLPVAFLAWVTIATIAGAAIDWYDGDGPRVRGVGAAGGRERSGRPERADRPDRAEPPGQDGRPEPEPFTQVVSAALDFVLSGLTPH
ncbi:TetR/AcrR family transcriptional regulator [Streptomyces sp. H27-D2]|uniref:TetR/AcrR family transcriptional regulator n=1 Tax=Streptomyces sp. H27-D2 TaxID=3046304 RepID=UPI002DBF4F89|nr:helix-turn-helix domain-containing protein [Streptomyces sp. H27-D2]MEC4020621.1 helix-turn-helix domain-containing protein [Streptomyces sp. H27-D2]